MNSASAFSIIGLTLAAAAGTVASIREAAQAQPAISSASAAPDGGLLLHFSADMADRANAQGIVDLSGKVNARIEVAPALVQRGPVKAVRFNGRQDWLTLSPDIARSRPSLPTREMTVSALVSLEHTQDWGSIIGCFQDNGNEEMGWNLGFNRDHFTLSLSSRGTDDGDGRMTTIASTTKIELGRWYHVAGVYDGTTMKLYINGKLEAESSEQSGEILYPRSAPFTIACYKDRNEQHATAGALLDVKLHSVSLDQGELSREVEANAPALAWMPPRDADQKFVAKPYLQFATQTGMTFMWETARPGRGFVEFTETLPFDSRSAMGSPGTMHEIRVEGLKPQTPYFWRARTVADDGTELLSDVLTFQTAVTPDNPFMFVVLGDTQRNPTVIRKLQDFSYTLRPNFQIHVGDVVNDGPDKTEWVNEMFPSSWGLMSRVPMFPCIGNHEEDHAHYYQYFSLPDPESWYTYTFGNAQFFVADTNKAIDPQSQQFKWLDAELTKSRVERLSGEGQPRGHEANQPESRATHQWPEQRDKPLRTRLLPALAIDGVMGNGNLRLADSVRASLEENDRRNRDDRKSRVTDRVDSAPCHPAIKQFTVQKSRERIAEEVRECQDRHRPAILRGSKPMRGHLGEGPPSRGLHRAVDAPRQEVSELARRETEPGCCCDRRDHGTDEDGLGLNKVSPDAEDDLPERVAQRSDGVDEPERGLIDPGRGSLREQRRLGDRVVAPAQVEARVPECEHRKCDDLPARPPCSCRHSPENVPTRPQATDQPRSRLDEAIAGRTGSLGVSSQGAPEYAQSITS